MGDLRLTEMIRPWGIRSVIVVACFQLAACSAPRMLTMDHGVHVPAVYRSGENIRGISSDHDSYVTSYDQGWWQAIDLFAEDIHHTTTDEDWRANGWSRDMAAYSAGYHDAEKRINALVNAYGEGRVQRHLQQISGDGNASESEPAKEQPRPVEPLDAKIPSRLGFSLGLDEKSAVHIAEVVLVKVYGKRVLEERPWDVKFHDGIYRIEGTQLGFIDGRRAELGGVALIEIRQSNGEVVYCMHGK